MSKKQTFNKEKIDTSKYINIDTGETLASEQPNLTSVNKVNSDYVRFKSESFFIIDDNVMNYLKDILSKADMYHVILMAQMVYGSYNYLHDKNLNVHNRETLQRDLDLARTAFNSLIRRLTKEGVIMETRGYKERKPFKYIMLNPNLARRTNTISTECATLFENFNKNKGMKPNEKYDK